MVMMRKTITIPDVMDGWVKSQIETGRYGNDSEYIRDLIRRDQDKKQAERNLFSMITEGLDSGISNSSIPDIMKKVENRLKNGKLSTYE